MNLNIKDFRDLLNDLGIHYSPENCVGINVIQIIIYDFLEH